MVLINKAINEVTVKLVYYGPGLCGKTTNLEKIYSNPKLENKGKMISMATETDRTLFFDFMPMELGTIAGQKVRIQLYTVPGQVFYDATRKLVLRGADGVVFVADSQESMRESNISSLENLKANLRLNRIDPDKIALVFQYNKRDLPNVSPVEEMSAYLGTGNAPATEAVALQGVGVTATFRAAVGRILENLRNSVDIALHDERLADVPALPVPLDSKDSPGGGPTLSPVGPLAVPTPYPATSSEPHREAAVFEEQFSEVSAMTDTSGELAEASPFAISLESSDEEKDDDSSPFSDSPAALAPTHVPAQLDSDSEMLLRHARMIIDSLESALEIARQHEADLLDRFQR